MVEPEVVPPDSQAAPRSGVKLTHLRALGAFGTALAILTMLTAFGVGLLALFGTTLLASALVWAFWPLIFSQEFSQFVFGAPRAPFWKLVLLFLAASAVLRMFRRYLRQR